jgi:excisionase family DNA binding protein
MTKIDNDTLLTRKEAAKYLGVQPETLAVWAWSGRYKLPYIKVGRVRYRKSDLDIFIRTHTIHIWNQ